MILSISLSAAWMHICTLSCANVQPFLYAICSCLLCTIFVHLTALDIQMLQTLKHCKELLALLCTFLHTVQCIVHSEHNLAACWLNCTVHSENSLAACWLNFEARSVFAQYLYSAQAVCWLNFEARSVFCGFTLSLPPSYYQYQPPLNHNDDHFCLQ